MDASKLLLIILCCILYIYLNICPTRNFEKTILAFIYVILFGVLRMRNIHQTELGVANQPLE